MYVVSECENRTRYQIKSSKKKERSTSTFSSMGEVTQVTSRVTVTTTTITNRKTLKSHRDG